MQAVTNRRLAATMGTPFRSSFVSFCVGTLVLLIASLITLAAGVPLSWSNVAASHWYSWCSGIFGALYVTSAIILPRYIGFAQFFVAFVAGQLAISLVFDTFGVLGLPQKAVNTQRLLCVAFAICAAALVQRPAAGGPASSQNTIPANGVSKELRMEIDNAARESFQPDHLPPLAAAVKAEQKAG